MKGKSATQAANRKAREAESALIEAKHQLKTRQEEWDKERQGLVAEIRNLKAAQRKDIEAAAAQSIQEVREQAARDMEDQRQKFGKRAVEAMRMLGDKGLPAKHGIDAAEMLGINYRDTFGDASAVDISVNRTARRVNTNKRLRRVVAAVDAAKASGQLPQRPIEAQRPDEGASSDD